MKKLLFLVVLAVAVVLPAFAQDAAPAAAPAAEPAAPAPAAEPAAPAAAPADAPKTDAPAAAPAPAPIKIEGKVIVAKGKEGAPDVVTFKTADAELTLLPGDKLNELLKIEKFEEKTFVLEGEKVAAKDGKSEGFMIKTFEEKKADAPAPDKK